MTGTADLGANIAPASSAWRRRRWRNPGFRFVLRAAVGRMLRRHANDAQKGKASEGTDGNRCTEQKFPAHHAERGQKFRNAILYRGLCPQELAKYA